MSRVFASASSEHATYDGTPPVTAAPFTVACWGRCTDGGNNFSRRVVSIGDKDVTNEMWGLWFRDFLGTKNIRWGAQTSAGERVSTTANGSWSPNTWHHLAGVEASATSRTAYVDGTAATANTTSRAPSGADRISIGKPAESSPSSGEYMTGDIAEVGIWDVALTDAEILALSRGIKPIYIRPASLVFYAPMYGAGTAVRDLVGGLSLTLSGTSASAHPRVFNKRPRVHAYPVSRDVSGAIAATLQAALFSGSGTQAQSGAIAAALQAATAAFAGAQTQTGPIAATLQAATFAATGAQGDAATGAMAGALQPATASLVGAMVPDGPIAATLQPATAALAGLQHPRGPIAATLQPPTAALVGAQAQMGPIAAVLLPPTFAGTGAQVIDGAMAATLQAALFSGTGLQVISGGIVATLTPATAALLGIFAPYRNIIYAVARDIPAIFAVAHDEATIAALARDLESITGQATDRLIIPATAYDLDSITGRARDG